MAPRVNKKRKSSDEENLDITAKCRNCDKNVPMCRVFQCSRNRQHYVCVDCLRIAAEEIVFENARNYDHEKKGINCYRNKCTGMFAYDEVKNLLIPEMAAALNAVMTVFNCAVCFLDHSMKDGITCQKVKETNEGNESHTFCFECIKEFAATDEAALAHGGVGLGCMQTGCEHALMLNQIRGRLSSAVIKKLEDRVMEENIGHAEIEGLQRCQKCNYAAEVIGGRYFVCVCGHKQCNVCGDTFDNKHSNVTCQKKKNKEDQTLDDQINSVVVRFCHKCNLQFVKSSGCNLMRCRCGATQCYICREQNISDNHFCKCPGLLEECKCTKRCRQFADANHIDAHRIELLKNHIKAGKKVSNQEILQSMPNRNVPEYEDSDDDEDDDDDIEDESDINFDDDDSMDENEFNAASVFARLQEVFERRGEIDAQAVRLPARNELPGPFLVRPPIQRAQDGAPRPVPRLLNLDDLRPSGARRIRRQERPVLVENQPRIQRPTFRQPSGDSNMPVVQNRPSNLSASSQPQRFMPPRLLLSDDSSDDEPPVQRNVVPAARPTLSSLLSLEYSSDEEPAVPRNDALPRSLLSSSSSSSEDSSDDDLAVARGVSRNETIVIDSSDDEVIDSDEDEVVMDSSEDDVVIDSDEDDVIEDSDDGELEDDLESVNGTVQLESDDEDQVIANASFEEENEDSDEEMFESANEDSTQAPTIELEDESDSDMSAVIDVPPRFNTEDSSDDNVYDSSEDEVGYVSSD